MSGQYIIAIDLGGQSAKIAIVDLDGQIRQKWSIHTNILDKGQHIVPDIIASIKDHLALYQLEEKNLLGIGMGSPGSVNQQAGTVHGAFNCNWEDQQDLATAFHQAFDLPFYLENDANIAALGEQRQGAGHNQAYVVLITLGTGIGGGIIIDDQIYHGKQGSAGEVGHMILNKDSHIQCTCGRYGCFEALASATGLNNLAREYSQRFSGPSAIKEAIDSGQEVTAKEIIQASQDNDLFAQKIFDEYTSYLGQGCANLIDILTPACIILGGGISKAGDYLLKAVQAKCDQYVFKALEGQTQIVLAELGNDAALIGAAELVKTREGLTKA